ncbi:hypothetical protein EMIT0P260_50183 [Pseudomonas sp. IT-P260]
MPATSKTLTHESHYNLSELLDFLAALFAYDDFRSRRRSNRVFSRRFVAVMFTVGFVEILLLLHWAGYL